MKKDNKKLTVSEHKLNPKQAAISFNLWPPQAC